MKNTLYYGDNLDILRIYIKDESVDLIYLDPPFNSKQDYNILFKERNGTQSSAQIKAFEDTWHWDRKAEDTYIEIVEKLPRKIADLIRALRSFLGENDMMAYLVMMAIRLHELHRVLKPTGSIYLHCDPTASHYLKLVMDAVFGHVNFRNEVIWKRTYAHGSSRRYGPVHDVILYYSRSDKYEWTSLRLPLDMKYIEKHFTHEDNDGRRFQPISLTGAGVRYGESGQPWRGVNPTTVGRHWALPSKLLDRLNIKEKTTQNGLDALDKAGMIYWPKKRKGVPRLKWFVGQIEGIAPLDVWIDINPISPQTKERLGYPTQKPETLLERIIKASSNEGDVVLDPFCGCGTTVVVAEKLKRNWIGIDVTHLAISLMRNRLNDTFDTKVEYTVIGEPVDLRGAEELAEQDRYQFQWWTLGLVGARPARSEQKKGADEGIDGYIYFHDDPKKKETKEVIIQVKSGHTGSGMIDALKGVVEKKNAQIGVFITLEEPTKPMKTGAVSSGYYKSPLGHNYPKIQILTIKELLEGKKIERPSKMTGIDATFKRAERHRGESGQEEMEL